MQLLSSILWVCERNKIAQRVDFSFFFLKSIVIGSQGKLSKVVFQLSVLLELQQANFIMNQIGTNTVIHNQRNCERLEGCNILKGFIMTKLCTEIHMKHITLDMKMMHTVTQQLYQVCTTKTNVWKCLFHGLDRTVRPEVPVQQFKCLLV